MICKGDRLRVTDIRPIARRFAECAGPGTPFPDVRVGDMGTVISTHNEDGYFELNLDRPHTTFTCDLNMVELLVPAPDQNELKDRISVWPWADVPTWIQLIAGKYVKVGDTVYCAYVPKTMLIPDWLRRSGEDVFAVVRIIAVPLVSGATLVIGVS